MKGQIIKKGICLPFIHLLLLGSLFCQMDTISIDFGNTPSALPWNNISDPNAGAVADLLNHKNAMTGISVAVVDSFNNINTAGTQDPDPALGLPPTATGDSFFGNVAPFGGQEQPTGGLEFNNLDTSRTYTLSMFASREAADNREAQYVITGQSNDTVYLDAASNTSMVAVADMRPDAEGRIQMIASPGPNNTNGSGFYYLGSVQLFYPEVPVAPARDTILVDFGDDISPAPWNNIVDPGGAEVNMLMNQNGQTTAFGLAVVDSFNNINRAGTQDPDPDIGFPPTATGDSFFGNVAPFGGQEQPTGGIQFNNLTLDKPYLITIFASREAADNREAQYVVTGMTADTLYLNASSNTDMVVTTEVEPDAGGNIEIIASPGPNNDNGSGFYYLGAIHLAYDAEPPVLPNDTVLIDFGSNLTPEPWNNMTDPAEGIIDDLVDGNNSPTGFGIAVVDSFNNINTAGTQTPDPDLGFPPTATGDSFFGNVAPFGGQEQPTGAVELFNLDTNYLYTLTIFASRAAADNREAQYAIQGAGTDTVFLNASDNTSMVAVAEMVPDATGNIRITASPGPNNDNGSGFYYLGLVKMSWELKPSVASRDTILIDFGNTPSPLPWNNISDPNAGQIADLLLSNTFSSGVSIEIYDDFNGINTNGTLSPDPGLGIPPTASGDSFFGNVAEFGGQEQPTAAMVLRNFDPAEPVEVRLFASRTASDNRETQYIVTGSETDTVFLNVASNTDQVASTTMLPAADGTIDIHASTGPNNTNSFGFYYLGALQLIYESTADQTASLDLVSPTGGEVWQVGKSPEIQWSSRNLQEVLLEYSVDNGENWDEIGTFPAISQAQEWTVPDMPTTEALIRISSDTLLDISDAPFTISSDTTTCTIVVLGSSTAAGTGASQDSSWVERYRNTLTQDNTRFNVVNLAQGGYTTYHILPDGTEIPVGVGVMIDTERNMTEALTYNPSAVIINMPSNDAASGYSAEAQLENFATLFSAGQSAGTQVYIATTQPRNFDNQAQIDIQVSVRDSILSRYGDQAIDFWTGIAAPGDTIDPAYDSGDGVHLNNDGHRILYERVLAKQLDTLPCSPISGIFGPRPEALNAVRLFPNPFSNGIQGVMDADASGELRVTVYDHLGRLVTGKTVYIGGSGQYTFSIDKMGDLAPAIYFVTVDWWSQGKVRSRIFSMVKQ